MEVKFKLSHPKAVLPSYAKEGDAGLDLTCVNFMIDEISKQITYFTGIQVEIPNGYVGLIFPRSSIRKYNLSLSNCVGVIDSGYRGEITFTFNSVETSWIGNIYKEGDRIGQLVIMPYPKIVPVLSDTLSETERGTMGFGSTGA